MAIRRDGRRANHRKRRKSRASRNALGILPSPKSSRFGIAFLPTLSSSSPLPNLNAFRTCCSPQYKQSCKQRYLNIGITEADTLNQSTKVIRSVPLSQNSPRAAHQQQIISLKPLVRSKKNGTICNGPGASFHLMLMHSFLG